MQQRIKELIKLLKFHDKLYNESRPIISDTEYDKLYFELRDLEQATGIIYPDSPTQTIHYDTVNALEKVEHNHPMLSLDKTQNWNEFMQYFDNKDVIGMLKLDGLTCSLHYKNGQLIAAETRGDGATGENILHNARVIKNIPQTIGFKGDYIVDGEVICTRRDFEPFSTEYTNIRNFASGSIRLLDSRECQKRNLCFIVWNVIAGDNSNSFMTRLEGAAQLGFDIVPWVSSFDWDAKEFLLAEAEKYGYPIDGLVGRFDDIAYGESLGRTSHHSKSAFAFKFDDEKYQTKVIDIDWTMGRTGQITPVAVFAPIEIDDTIVTRASLHNLSIMEALGLRYKYTKVLVVKANQIIPQIAQVLPYTWEIAEPFEIPSVCPICGQPTSIKTSESGAKELYCENPQCEGKLINRLDHFASKKGLDIKGLSKATIAVLLEQGWLNSCLDIFLLYKYADKWKKLSGFGEKSVEKILAAIESAKNCTLDKFIAALGIPLIGTAQSKELCKYISSYGEFREKINNQFNFAEYNGFAEAKTSSLLNFDYSEADEIYKFLNCGDIVEEKLEPSLAGIKVVITGTVHEFKNRNELAAAISARGGQVVSAISKNVNYLINNDVNSTSAKNLAAQRAGIPILSEKEFMKKFDF